MVKEGDQIRAGQTIYRIRNDFALASLSELQITIYAKQATEARLIAELNGAEDIQFPREILEKVPNIVDNERKLFLQKRTNYVAGISVLEQQADQKRSQVQEDKAKLKKYISDLHKLNNSSEDNEIFGVSLTSTITQQTSIFSSNKTINDEALLLQ
jgi:multidrug efflux pump subunit AcrA (membrane-fusion protein)